MLTHGDDGLHLADNDDPFWTETWWFDFIIPDRKLSGQLYAYILPNLGVCSSAAYLWDDSGSQLSNCLYARVFWQLPMPEGDLSDMKLANGMQFRCIQPLTKYQIRYLDPDEGKIDISLIFDAICEPYYLTEGHFDQPGHFVGTIRIHEEDILVDSYGMRDRSWFHRTQFGTGMWSGQGPGHGAFDFATASADDGFHAITFDLGEGCVVVGGYLLRDGTMSKLVSGRREVLEREDDAPVRIRIAATDELGRELKAEGLCVNRLHLMMNPNLLAWNSLTEWRFGNLTAWGEDRDNWTAATIRRFRRREISQ